MSCVAEWSPTDVGKWLKSHGFDDYVNDFENHKIDGKCLLMLSEEDLRAPPLQLRVLGDIKRLGMAMRVLQQDNAELVADLLLPATNSCPNHVNSCDTKQQTHQKRSKRANLISPMNKDEDDETGDESEDDLYDEEFLLSKNGSNANHSIKKEMRPEAWKALVAMAYFFSATWITAIVMVIVHDRVPDMQTYPPLPDIFLDNVPLIPWAFYMCEVCGVTLFLMWFLILVFHRHRFILLRRTFSLFGSVFFLRCVTMLITSLSVPGRHLQCKARPYGSWLERLYQAFLIWQGGGMSLQGVRTCGDYMFSGHTVVITLLNFFITEYTPISLYFIHTVSWVLNLFGIFFILAAHEHYSIDVFIAFYISTRLFLYYHTLANNRSLYQGDSKRTRIWFPLFYFFESGVRGRVPNEFESPFRLPNCLVRYLKIKETTKND